MQRRPGSAEPLLKGGVAAAEPDYVQIEVEFGLKNREVIPVLVGAGIMPKRHELPANMAGLATIQSISIRDGATYRADIGTLISAIRAKLGSPEAQRSKGRKIFISYRRNARAKYAARLIREAIEIEFEAGATFFDVEDLAPGEYFPDQLLDALKESAILVVVIDEDWKSPHWRQGGASSGHKIQLSKYGIAGVIAAVLAT